MNFLSKKITLTFLKRQEHFPSKQYSFLWKKIKNPMKNTHSNRNIFKIVKKKANFTNFFTFEIKLPKFIFLSSLKASYILKVHTFLSYLKTKKTQ